MSTLPNLNSLASDSEVALIEALLFANGEAMALDQILRVCGLSSEALQEILNRLEQRYSAEGFGVEIVRVAGKVQIRTKAKFSAAVRELKTELPRRLSKAALETLAVIAYRQPVVKSDIEKIRGVDVTPTLKSLIERKLVKIVGHQASVGSPALYGTTDEFLHVFGLNNLSELPTLRDITELDSDPGEVGGENEFGQEGQQEDPASQQISS